MSFGETWWFFLSSNNAFWIANPSTSVAAYINYLWKDCPWIDSAGPPTFFVSFGSCLSNHHRFWCNRFSRSGGLRRQPAHLPFAMRSSRSTPSVGSGRGRELGPGVGVSSLWILQKAKNHCNLDWSAVECWTEKVRLIAISACTRPKTMGPALEIGKIM